jgi:hypothetical protein
MGAPRAAALRSSSLKKKLAGLVLWIREQSAYCHDLNFNSGGGGRTPNGVGKCGGSAWFTGGPTPEVVAKAV